MDFRKYDGIVGGVEQVVLNITKGVTSKGHNVIILCKKKILEKTQDLFRDFTNLKIIPLDAPNHSISKENEILDSTTIQDIAEKEGAGLIHFPYNWSFPSNKKVPTILTIHDVIPFTFREAMDEHTNKHIYKPAIKRACELNDVVVTISDFSKRDIAERAGTPIEKIQVIPNGLRILSELDKTLEENLTKNLGLNNGFILNVGGIHERKNIVRLIYAFGKFVKQTEYKGKLLITGNVSGAPYQEKMKKLCDEAVRQTGMNEKIIFTGFISDEELDTLFRITEFIIYPSLYEGFGMPVLEGMKAGVPVITSNTTAMPEVAADAALLINPEDIDDMASAMSKLFNNKTLKDELVQKGKKQTNKYSWEITVNEYIALYEKVIKDFKK